MINELIHKIGVERPPRLNLILGHGESALFRFELYRAGERLQLDGYTATLYYKEPTASEWFTAPATISDNILSFRWSAELDGGAGAYEWFLRVENGTDICYRINGGLRLLDTPGFMPSAITLPREVLDFSQLEVRNAPWDDIEPVTVDQYLIPSSPNPIANGAVAAALGGYATKSELAEKANTADLAAVATSGSYNNLTDKPTIPPAVTVDAELSDTSTNPVQSKAIYNALHNKVDTNDLLSYVNKIGDTMYGVLNFDAESDFRLAASMNITTGWTQFYGDLTEVDFTYLAFYTDDQSIFEDNSEIDIVYSLQLTIGEHNVNIEACQESAYKSYYDDGDSIYISITPYPEFEINGGTYSIQLDINLCFDKKTKRINDIMIYNTNVYSPTYDCANAYITDTFTIDEYSKRINKQGEALAESDIDSIVTETFKPKADGSLLISATDGSSGYAGARQKGSLSHGYANNAYADFSHVEGWQTSAYGIAGHAEGRSTQADGRYSHSEGEDTRATADSTHSSGRHTRATAIGAQSSGMTCKATHNYAFSWSGYDTGTEAYWYNSHGAGTFNLNPTGGANGVYIGEKTLSTIINEAIVAKLTELGIITE